MSPAIYTAARACAIALLAGVVLHAADVTTGNGVVIDWRTVKSGETVSTGVDAFDAAQMFVVLVGEESALASLDEEPAPAPEPTPIATRVYEFCVINAIGGRRRTFETPQGFVVYVEPDGDDAAQAAFVARLAAFCDGAAS